MMESLGCASASREKRGFTCAFGPSSAKENARFQDARSPLSRSWLHLTPAGLLWADLVASPFPPLPGCGLLPCACPAREWELRQRQGEGEGKAGRCRTPLPFGFRETLVSISAVGAAGREMLFLPRSLLLSISTLWWVFIHPLLHTQLSAPEPELTALVVAMLRVQETSATRGTFSLAVEEDPGPLPKLRDVPLSPLVFDGPCWEPQRAVATAVIGSDY